MIRRVRPVLPSGPVTGRPILRAAVAALLLAASSATVSAEPRGGTLAGTVELWASGGARRLPAADAVHGVVYFRPAAGASVRPAAEPAVLTTRDKEFSPRVLVVTEGTVVRFPNEDPILHNVFSVSPGNAFDVGLYGPGDGEEHRFDAAGLVRVYCNVHHAMAAHVVVLDTPHWAIPGADGSFRLDGLPPGPGTLTVWQESAEPWSVEVVVPAPGAAHPPIVAKLEASRRRVPRHLNKFGRPYGSDDRERYR